MGKSGRRRTEPSQCRCKVDERNGRGRRSKQFYRHRTEKWCDTNNGKLWVFGRKFILPAPAESMRPMSTQWVRHLSFLDSGFANWVSAENEFLLNLLWRRDNRDSISPNRRVQVHARASRNTQTIVRGFHNSLRIRFNKSNAQMISILYYYYYLWKTIDIPWRTTNDIRLPIRLSEIDE